MDTWYLVSLAFDGDAGTYDFTVRDASLAEIVRVEGVAFGNAAASLDRLMAYTSSGFVGHGVVDDARVRAWCGHEPVAAVGSEELNPLSGVPAAGAPGPAALGQNFPNPFNPVTVIPVDLDAARHVTLAVYDLRGRRVATLVDGTMGGGHHEIPFDGTKLASGRYVYRLEEGGPGRAMTLVK